MRFVKIILICLLFLAGYGNLSILAATDELQLVYQVELQKLNPAQTQFGEITIGLGEDYFYILEQSQKTLYDFTKRRIFYIDQSRKQFSDTSLYSVIDARRNKLAHRLFLISTIQGLNEQERDNAFFEWETFYSLESSAKYRHNVKTAEEHINNDSRYRFKDNIMIEATVGKEPLSETYRQMWVKYLLYECRLHPIFYKSLVLKTNIFQSLSYHYQDDSSSYCRILKLKKVKKSVQKGDKIPQDYQLSGEADNHLSQVIVEVRSNKSQIPLLTSAELKALTLKAYEAKNYLEALLIYLEHRLQFDKDMDGESERLLLPRIKSDPQLELCLILSSGGNPHGISKIIPALDAINRDNLTRGYIIDLLKAVEFTKQGEYELAQELLVKVLDYNPYLAITYLSLGKIFYSRQEPIAWQCWELGEKLTPDHILLTEIKTLKKQLESDFPDAFLPLPSLATVTREKVFEILKEYVPDGFYVVDTDEKVRDEISKYRGMSWVQKSDFMAFVKSGTEIEMLKSFNTLVHETCHDYCSMVPYKLCKERYGNASIGINYDAYYAGNGNDFLVKKTAVFNTKEIAASIPEKLRTFRFMPYVTTDRQYKSAMITEYSALDRQTSENMASQIYGVFGLLEEFTAYYNGTRASLDLYKFYRDKLEPTIDNWFSFITAVESTYYAHMEFKFFILKYLQYAKTHYPKIYKEILENQDFCRAFLEIDRNFSQVVAVYYQRRDEIFEKFYQLGYAITINEDFYDIKTPANTKSVSHFGKVYSLLKKELEKEEYQLLLAELGK